MKHFHLRQDLERVVIRGFALPLGIAPPPGRLDPPAEGYTVAFVPGEDEEPDTYSFHIVVSHERIAPILHRAFQLLPEEVFGIVEIGSRDAYRSTDTYISEDPISRDQFLETWTRYEPFLLEDSSIAAGANSEEPFVEVFVDQWKGIAIHVPPDLRYDIDAMLREFGLEEVVQTWPDVEPSSTGSSSGFDADEDSPVRSVLDLSDENSPDIDELLLDLRHAWQMDLNVDPEANIDDGGRNLGSTLWHAVVILDRVNADGEQSDRDAHPGGYASVWATATSLNEVKRLIERSLTGNPDWTFGEIYTIDRVAFDERPDELADLRLNRREPQVHLLTIEPWSEPEE